MLDHFLLHAKDIATDYNIQACHIINITETALIEPDPNEPYDFVNFGLMIMIPSTIEAHYRISCLCETRYPLHCFTFPQ